jgi:adenosylmethionine-8-amino-7-oxononanoate aminotransferase
LERLDGVANVRVLGTVLAMELTSTDAGYLSAIGPALGKFAIERGVLLRPLGNTVYVLPPYCSTAGDLSTAYDTIAEFVDARAR